LYENIFVYCFPFNAFKCIIMMMSKLTALNFMSTRMNTVHSYAFLYFTFAKAQSSFHLFSFSFCEFSIYLMCFPYKCLFRPKKKSRGKFSIIFVYTCIHLKLCTHFDCMLPKQAALRFCSALNGNCKTCTHPSSPEKLKHFLKSFLSVSLCHNCSCFNIHEYIYLLK
jgi:hypothetical protein